MNKTLVAACVMVLSFPVFAKKSPTIDFVNDIETAINSTGEVSTSLDITCPAQSASGRVLVTHADYTYGMSKGVFVFKNTDDIPAEMKSIIPIHPDNDIMSDVISGWDFGFKIRGGQFFVTVMKNGEVKAGINKNGTSGVTEVKCKVAKPE